MNSKIILCLNAGSSSLKFALYQIADGNETPLAQGAVEHDGQTCRLWVYTAEQKIDKTDKVAFTLSAALHPAVTELEQLKLPPLDAVGDRVVQGGPDHAAPRTDDRFCQHRSESTSTHRSKNASVEGAMVWASGFLTRGCARGNRPLAAAKNLTS